MAIETEAQQLVELYGASPLLYWLTIIVLLALSLGLKESFIVSIAVPIYYATGSKSKAVIATPNPTEPVEKSTGSGSLARLGYDCSPL